jgi:hypothetical protein
VGEMLNNRNRISVLIPLTLLIASFATMVIADITLSDIWNWSEKVVIINGANPNISISDAFNWAESLGSFGQQLIVTVTTTVVSTIQVIGTGQCGSSCFNYGGNFYGVLMTEVVAPIVIIMANAFGLMYMGIKTIGAIITIESFVIMVIAYIGIIPSWFNLLIIILVSAALAKLLIGFFKGE